MSARFSRRDFMETLSFTAAGLMTAGCTTSARGYAANETITVGCIGTGGRCRQLMGALESAVDKGWKRLDPRLRWLAVQAAAGEIGCSWCTDFGYYEGVQQGVDPRKVRDVPVWRSSDAYDERERAVLEYAEGATSTPAEVSEDLVRRLHAHFSDAEIVELAGFVALENFRSRFNAGLGLHSQGFSDNCKVPQTV